uniref:Small ribosomal subunit protein uS14m n=1 Tax=Ostreobium quekettii TaxID=121088 RepID=A0A650BXD7_9CHLO|nr:ribosomal protein S14 [Ostreobium quekettii]QGQ62005.1 ribosomal protein S14 [Ostreobium quekettii]
MANSIQRDKKRRNLVYKYETQRVEYKSLIANRSIPIELRNYYVNKLNKLSRSSSTTRLRNRCIKTGRSRAVYRFCKLSRITMRQLAAQGFIMGLTKTSW